MNLDQSKFCHMVEFRVEHVKQTILLGHLSHQGRRVELGQSPLDFGQSLLVNNKVMTIAIN